ncbi:MAG: DUF2971 domain-containing protein [Clostridiales bacterium]|nr:DUF2971 domain-containing protein [Clostridiales bacterium]
MNNNLVFYYCNVSTALSILQNHEIWMTSIRNLNDGNETVGVYKMLFNLLEKYDKKNCLSKMFEFASHPGAIQLYETPLGAYPEYITCFSENSDSVSQWIAYADNGQGIAIGFDETAFSQISSKKELTYQSVTYVSEKELQNYIPKLYEYLLANSRDNGFQMMDIAMEKIKQTYPAGINLKTMHYDGEKEKRIIYQYPEKIENLPEGWEIKKIKAYPKSNMINTCIPLKFPKDIIKKIVTGPKYQKNYYELETAMEALGYAEVEICESTSSYR